MTTTLDAAVPAQIDGHAVAKSLRLDRVTKTYGGFHAVDDVTLDVPRGEFLTLLGPSGSGKTTILMMIAGFTRPTSGEILVDGRPITALAPERRNFGVVFQGYALFPHMTVAENIAYPLSVRGMARAEIATRVKRAMAQVRLYGLADRRPKQLSGGQQQRVAIARALVFDPDILLFDEPLGALDKKLRGEVQVELKSLHDRLGSTFVYVTHDQDEALSMSDRVVIANDGRIVQAGAPRELYERPATRFVADFLGKSNFLHGEIAEHRPDGAVWTAKGMRFEHRGAVHEHGRGQALFALRPEKVRLLADGEAAAGNAVQATVTAISYLGATIHLVCDTGLGPISATAFAGMAPASLDQGSRLWLGWDPGATVSLIHSDQDGKADHEGVGS